MVDFSRAADPFLGKSEKSLLYLGNSVDDTEMWLTDDQVRTHTFVTGSTGSGKSELLISMAANAMAWGSGVTIIDGKSDMSLFAKLHAVATSLGREDDIYVLNFMQGQSGATNAFRSHTINPLASMAGDEILQFVSSFVEESSSGDHAMWRGRAIALMGAIIPMLVWCRDEMNMPFGFDRLREVSSLKGVIALLDQAIEYNAPERITAGLRGYLLSLPGFDSGRTNQSSTTNDQHGYLSMQFTRMFGLIADHYNHIFGSLTPDVDLADVVKNRRILIVLLPSLEKSSSEIGSIGRMLVSLLKSLMGKALRSTVEGEWDAVVGKSATHVEPPYLVIMDEVGHYMSDGMGLMAAQARSLGIGLVFATQEVDSMFSKNSAEASAILANTNTKIFLKAENPGGANLGSLIRIITEQDRHTRAIEKEIHGAKVGIHHFNLHYAEPWNSSYNVEAMSRLHDQALDKARSIPPDILEVRLQMLQPGQMLVVHGGRNKWGYAPFIQIEGNRHRIVLSRFYETSSFVQNWMDVEAKRERMRSLRRRLSSAAKQAVETEGRQEERKPERQAVAIAVSILDEIMSAQQVLRVPKNLFTFPEC